MERLADSGAKEHPATAYASDQQRWHLSLDHHRLHPAAGPRAHRFGRLASAAAGPACPRIRRVTVFESCTQMEALAEGGATACRAPSSARFRKRWAWTLAHRFRNLAFDVARHAF